MKCLRRRGFLHRMAKVPSANTVNYRKGRMRTARDAGGWLGGAVGGVNSRDKVANFVLLPCIVPSCGLPIRRKPEISE
jgi:hypothetical protein